MGYKSKKVSSNDTDGFKETKKFDVLHCGNISGNNNKFYCIELQYNSNARQYRLFTHYGRLGKTNIYEVRGPASKTELNDLEKEYAKILKKKMRGKKVKLPDGSINFEKYEKVDTFSPKVGSPNICGKSIDVKSIKSKVDLTKLSKGDPEIDKIVSALYEENIHEITQVTSLTLSNKGLETPLGPLSLAQIAKAKSVLDELQGLMGGLTKINLKTSVKNVNNEYFSLVPHQFGTKIPDTAWILSWQRLQEEYDLVDNLESAVTVGNKDNTSKKLMDLGVSIFKLEDTHPDFISIKDNIKNTSQDRHYSTRGHKVINVFKINQDKVEKTWKALGEKLTGPKYHLFHGSRNCNVLSILINGLIIPPYDSKFCAGRMFGNGIYAASSSTKSMNYSVGYWGGRKSKYNNFFMFIVEFSMGKIYEVESTLNSGAPSGYDSIHAKAGKALLNDEYIVYNTGQCRITHLVELSK